MQWLTKLKRDEAGAVLSSELVLVGTLGVIGATVGLNALSTALNEELEDVAFAIRSLDQSYAVAEVRGCGAYTAGSSFTQEPVKESLKELDEQMDRHEAEVEKRWKELEKKFDQEQRKMEKQPEMKKPETKQPEKKPELKKPETKQPEKKPEMKKPDDPKRPPMKKPGKKNRKEEEVLL